MMLSQSHGKGFRDSKVDSRAEYTPVLFDTVVSETLQRCVGRAGVSHTAVARLMFLQKQ